MFYIILKRKNKILGKAKSIEINFDKGTLSLFDFDKPIHTNDVENTKLILDIYHNTYKYGYVRYTKIEIHTLSHKIKLNRIHFSGDIYVSDDYNPYQAKLMSHLTNHWQNGYPSNIDRNIFEQDDYCMYLETISIYGREIDQFSLKQAYTIDGQQIQNKCDLYIQLGELFAGPKIDFCYFLDQLDKRLRDFLQTENIRQSKFRIKNAPALQALLGEDYFSRFIEVIESYFKLEVMGNTTNLFPPT